MKDRPGPKRSFEHIQNLQIEEEIDVNPAIPYHDKKRRKNKPEYENLFTFKWNNKEHDIFPSLYNEETPFNSENQLANLTQLQLEATSNSVNQFVSDTQLQLHQLNSIKQYQNTSVNNKSTNSINADSYHSLENYCFNNIPAINTIEDDRNYLSVNNQFISTIPQTYANFNQPLFLSSHLYYPENNIFLNNNSFITKHSLQNNVQTTSTTILTTQNKNSNDKIIYNIDKIKISPTKEQEEEWGNRFKQMSFDNFIQETYQKIEALNNNSTITLDQLAGLWKVNKAWLRSHWRVKENKTMSDIQSAIKDFQNINGENRTNSSKKLSTTNLSNAVLVTSHNHPILTVNSIDLPKTTCLTPQEWEELKQDAKKIN